MSKGPAAVEVWCHNPQVVPFRSGFALFHVGLGTGGHPVNCSAAEALEDLGKRASTTNGSTLHLASSLNGPWEPVMAGVLPSNCNNPAPAMHPNGSWFVVCDSTALFRLELAEPFCAPVGKWTRIATLAPTQGSVPGTYEDAFLFFDTATPPAWHALFHIWTTLTNVSTCADSTVAGLAFSRDGLDWRFAASEPYSNVVHFADGSSLVVPTRERPMLLFDPLTREPTHLFTGATGGVRSCFPEWCSHCKMDAWDFTLVQGVASS